MGDNDGRCISRTREKISHKLGQVLMRARQLGLATAEFAEAVRLAPARPELRSDLGLARVLTGDRKGAEAEFREALRLDPSYLLARHRLGLVLLEDGRAAEAVPLFEAVLAADPSFTPARTALEKLGHSSFSSQD
jgi:cytochrome c-type biogenesis protein CcmH/NrfG